MMVHAVPASLSNFEYEPIRALHQGTQPLKIASMQELSFHQDVRLLVHAQNKNSVVKVPFDAANG